MLPKASWRFVMRVYAIATGDNDTSGKYPGDCTGAFIPGARRIASAYGGGYATFHNAQSHEGARDDLIKAVNDMPGGLDMFAYFGHGVKTQLGNMIWEADRQLFADAIRAKLSDGASVMLYSCLAGQPGGVTEALRDLIGKRVWVYGHTTAKHSFLNPDISEAHNGAGARFRMIYDIIGSDLSAAWADALQFTDMWLRFPLMHYDDIKKELNAIRLVGTWSVPGQSDYIFTWPIKNGSYTTEDSLCVNPNGVVQDAVTRETGTWEIDDELIVTWSAVDKERWSMPVNPNGQMIKNASGFARRKARGKFGSLQG